MSATLNREQLRSESQTLNLDAADVFETLVFTYETA
jgi:hypothetical protein